VIKDLFLSTEEVFFWPEVMSLSLTAEQIERYSRQILVPDFGGKGQIRLRQGRVLIIGAGGLGSPSALYLAAAGVGTLGLIDADDVELSNLQRQILHATADLGKAKVESGKETLTQLNPDVEVIAYPARLEPGNIDGLFPSISLLSTAAIILRPSSWSTMLRCD
jgi:adenylyltransferase/sulfurtransferase